MKIVAFYVRKYKRIIIFCIVGGAVALFGSALLYLFADILHIEQNTAYFLQTVFALQANFSLNDLITWGDLRLTNGPYWQRWGKFHIARIGTVVICQVIFYFLVTVGVYHMIAFGINIFVGMVINYVTSDKFVFQKGIPHVRPIDNHTRS